MRNRRLADALAEFARDAASRLADDAAGDESLPFDLVEQPGERVPLYCYRPLSEDYIRARVRALGRLPSYATAASALGALGGLDAYLRARGEPRIPSQPGERVDAALRSFLGRVFAESSDFDLDEADFDAALHELEEAVYEDRVLVSVAARLHGFELASRRVELGEGLALVRADGFEGRPPAPAGLPGPPAGAVWAVASGESSPAEEEERRRDRDPAEPVLVGATEERLATLLTALRLYGDGGAALGARHWTVNAAEPWREARQGSAAPGAHGVEPIAVPAECEDELRGFCNLVASRVERLGGGQLAWSLCRFELGCERPDPFDALTDHLLALRALLEPEGPASGRLAGRLAAICGVPEDRRELAERVAHAISLERAVIAGHSPLAEGAEELALEIADHLRAMLRDVLCGHLDEDLHALADELISEAPTGERDALAPADEADAVEPATAEHESFEPATCAYEDSQDATVDLESAEPDGGEEAVEVETAVERADAETAGARTHADARTHAAERTRTLA